jgi:hypothetical protein
MPSRSKLILDQDRHYTSRHFPQQNDTIGQIVFKNQSFVPATTPGFRTVIDETDEFNKSCENRRSEIIPIRSIAPLSDRPQRGCSQTTMKPGNHF